MVKFCSLYSGSSGNCIFVGTEKGKILLDAGLSGKKIIEALRSVGEQPADISAILVTHEHSDHIRGAGILSRKFDIPIYANENTWKAMEWCMGPVDAKNRRTFAAGTEFCIGDIGVQAFPIPHDAAEPVGFNLFAENKKITTFTDIGHINNRLLACLENSDLILIESNHDIEMLKVGPYPWALKQRILGNYGHLSNEMAGKVVAYMAGKGTQRFLLGHLSKENNFPELAYQTVCNILHEKNIAVGTDILLEVLRRDCTSQVFEL